MRRLRLCVLMLLVVTTGCGDAYFRVRQAATLRVTSRASERVKGAQVWLVHAGALRDAQLVNEEAWWARNAQGHSAIDNSFGQAVVPVSISWVTGGLFADTDLNRDRLSGKPYACRVESGSLAETFQLVMTPGTFVSGDHFGVEVRSIGRPVRVKD